MKRAGLPHKVLRRVQTSIDRAVGTLLPRAVRLIARDCSNLVTTGHLLVLAPHPDDETLSSGATVQRTLSGGGKVTIVLATDGRYGDPEAVAPEPMATIRRDELEHAIAVLGLAPSSLVMLGFEDATLSRNEDRLAEALHAVIVMAQPEVLIAPCPWDLHPDHAALGRVTRRILAGRPVQHLEYLVWCWDQPSRLVGYLARRTRVTRGHWTFPARPVLVDGTDYVDKKAEALACHSSQFSPTATFNGHSIGGSGPLGNEFLRSLDHTSELFFLRTPGPSASPSEELQTW